MNIIFTRHEITSTQKGMMMPGCVLDASDLAHRELHTIADATIVLDEIASRAPESHDLYIYGVIPPIMRGILNSEDRDNAPVGQCLVTYCLYEAHNINRASEGEPPTFEFGGWVHTGSYGRRMTERVHR